MAEMAPTRTISREQRGFLIFKQRDIKVKATSETIAPEKLLRESWRERNREPKASPKWRNDRASEDELRA